jgi:hypothetical protein
VVGETTLLLRQGDLMVEFLWVNLPADVSWAEVIFSQLRRSARK